MERLGGWRRQRRRVTTRIRGALPVTTTTIFIPVLILASADWRQTDLELGRARGPLVTTTTTGLTA
jgi:hypothetical protein